MEKPYSDKELRTKARLAWNGWDDSEASRKILAEAEAKDQHSADAWDRVIQAIKDVLHDKLA